MNQDISIDDWNHHWKALERSAQLNPAQSYRRKLIFASLALGQASAPVNVLDIGSGQGDFARDLLAHRHDAKVLGLELSQKGVEISRAKVPRAHFVQQDLLEYKEPPEEFRNWSTHAVCSEVLEHVETPETILENIRPYMSSGAKLVLTVPRGPMSAFDKHIGHRRHYELDDFARLVRGSGYEIDTIFGAGFPFFNLYRRVVVARGQKLICDVSSGDGGASFAARVAMRAFGILFRANIDRSRLGWQVVCVARKI